MRKASERHDPARRKEDRRLCLLRMRGPEEGRDSRYCDRCGVILTRDNNKKGYEICDKCNEWLEEWERSRNENQITVSI